MKELMEKLNAAVDEALSLIGINEILKVDYETKNSELEKEIERHGNLSSECVDRLKKVEAREKVCDLSESIADRETKVIEKERASDVRQNDLNEAIRKHDQKMKDENSTLDARASRLATAETALDKEKAEYTVRIKNELIRQMSENG